MLLYILLKKGLFNAVEIYKLKLEYKSEDANTTCTIYHLNPGAFQLTTIGCEFLRLGNYKQTPNEIMTNQGKNKSGNHINTGASFNLIHYMANLLGWSKMAKWTIFAPFLK